MHPFFILICSPLKGGRAASFLGTFYLGESIKLTTTCVKTESSSPVQSSPVNSNHRSAQVLNSGATTENKCRVGEVNLHWVVTDVVIVFA